MEGGQEMDRGGGRIEVCRSNRWRDISKSNVSRDEEEGADVGFGFNLLGGGGGGSGGGGCSLESCGVMAKKVWQ